MSETKAIAFFLPQFHPIPENDKWWGKGFTEWTNVSRATPVFPGHYQPHLPGELGYYDLRLPEVRAQQAALARKYGVYGFCYYYYWFNGKRLLERPLDEILKSGEPDFPFCICWANENWTRRWDGAEQEVLMKQEHSPQSDEAFIHDVIPILKDSRYIRVNGKPMLLVYRPGILPDPVRTTEIWRNECRKAGFEVHLCAVQSFGLGDPRPLGFDSAVEFPPHGLPNPAINNQVEGLHPEFTGYVFDYREVVNHAINKPPTDYRQFRGLMTAWDNTARRRLRSSIFLHSSPREYEVWLRAMIAATEVHNPPGERFVFINAWNEWAEGTHLEPDQKYGYAFLEATARALAARTDWRDLLKLVRGQPELPADVLRQYLSDLEFALESYDRSVNYLRNVSAVTERISAEMQLSVFTDVVPQRLRGTSVEQGGMFFLDKVYDAPVRHPWIIDRGARISVEGWAAVPGIEPTNQDTHAHLVLRSKTGERSYFAPLFHRNVREDVVRVHADIEKRFLVQSGYRATLWCQQVPPGEYQLGVIHTTSARAAGTFLSDQVVVR